MMNVTLKEAQVSVMIQAIHKIVNHQENSYLNSDWLYQFNLRLEDGYRIIN